MDSASFLAGFFVGLAPGLVIGALLAFLFLLRIRTNPPDYENPEFYTDIEQEGEN
jgi:hypothetical protein